VQSVRRIWALGIVGVVVLLLVVAQLVLPGIAAQLLHDRLARSGTDVHVEVHAFPAIELLWHQADRVVVHVGRYRSPVASLSSLLNESGNVDSLDASAGEMTAGLLTLRDATLRKRGDTLTGTGHITQADLRAAIPILDGVQLVSSAGGQLTLRGTATLFGLTASVDATLSAENGALIVRPNVPLLGALTVFSDPHVAIEGVTATATTDGFSVSAQAKLH
jgi:hypothetical protein